MTPLRAMRIGSHVQDRLAGLDAPLDLLARFPRHVYLATRGPAPVVLVVTRSDEPPGPLNLHLDRWPDWPEAGATGHVATGQVTLPGMTIVLGEALTWPSAVPVPGRIQPEALARIAAIARSLPHGSDLLVRVLAGQISDLAGFAQGLRQGDAARISRGAGELVGRGQGLTPSGDDFLCGTLLAAHAGGRPDAAAPILAAATGATTTLSGAFLHAAAAGHAPEAWHGLLAELDRPSAAEVAAVIAPGHSSGGDTLAGFLWAAPLFRTAP